MIEYLKAYDWHEYEPILYPAKKVDNLTVKGFNPPEEMQYCSREQNSVIFFKRESDMIAFDNRNEDLNDKILTARGKSLARKVYD